MSNQLDLFIQSFSQTIIQSHVLGLSHISLPILPELTEYYSKTRLSHIKC
ncbi:hypothetical protein HMPREF9103_01608 [Lentilactobacillus parafarraginis F0439]|uniref:Uncharacterized protein n=1 Tax=Lentilactobacillus parafarraginis F0439 TaxID=797515 RepID=G9ZPF4_9LACO|nr:hypothetical protein HMPREF9103_01608 [Lentilactobacillus parafarraginis F0439]